jgi:hypothetical protein
VTPGMTILDPTVRFRMSTYISEDSKNQSLRDWTKRDDISEKLSICIRRVVLGSNLGRDTG